MVETAIAATARSASTHSRPIGPSAMTDNSTLETPQAEPEPSASTVEPDTLDPTSATAPSEPPPSFVKLAMRNMVRKGGQSLFHFTLTAVSLVGLLIGLSYLTR